jgi:DNA topoisomerase-2
MDETGMRFSMQGEIERTNDTTLVISELPVRVWTQTYKEFLEKMMVPDEKTKSEPQIKDFMENHTESTVAFTITADKAKIDAWEKLPKGGLYAKFKLMGSLNNSNMTVFDVDTRIVKYDNPEDIMKEFFKHRMDFYVRRKALLVQKLEKEQRMLSNRARFVEEVCSGELVVSNRKKIQLLNALQERGYDLFDKTEKTPENEEADEEEEASTATLSKGYEYLLGMKIWSLTFEKAEELRSQLAERTSELEALQATTPSDIWLRDLDNIELALDERDGEMEEAEADEQRAVSKNKKHQANKAKAAASKKRGKKKADAWDSDMEDDSEDEPDMDSDDEVVVAKKPVARRKPAAAKKTAPKAPAPKAAAPKAAAVKKSTAQPVAPVQPKVVEEEPVIDEVELTLAQRMAKLLSPSKAAAAAKPPSSSTGTVSISTSLSFSDEENARGTKRPSPRNNDSDDESLDAVPVAKTAKPKAKRTKAAATKKAAPKKAPARKKKQPEPDSESEDDFAFDEDSEDSEVEEVQAPPVRPRAGGRSARAAATKNIVYDLSSDEEGSDSDFE